MCNFDFLAVSKPIRARNPEDAPGLLGSSEYNRSMAISAGSDVESICSKCGDVWHVVVAMVGDQVARVVCKECGGQHRYRPPGGKGKAAPKTARARKTATKRTAPKPAAGPAVEPDIARPTRAYSPLESYQTGDRVDHVKFGIGVVEAIEPGKMQVWFPVGRKVLVQAKPTGGLQRPAPFVHDEPDG